MYSIAVKPKDDIKIIRIEYLNILLRMFKYNDLKVISYSIDEIKDKTFIKFKYTMVTIGKALRVMEFFSDLIEKHNYFFIRNFEKNKVLNNLTNNNIYLELTCNFE